MLSGGMVEKYSDVEAWLHDRFVAERALNLHFYLLRQTALEDVLAEKRPRTVLDVGCGGGQLALRLKALYPHLELTGIDLSTFQIAGAQRRARRQGCPVHFEVADAQALPFPDAYFDVVCSLGSIKHWPDPLQGIAECWRVLKAGGELLLTDSTSDATREQVASFYHIVGFPKPLEKPFVSLFYRFMIRPARPIAVYQEIATQLDMPPGTVTHPPYMPTFLFRTRKPHPQT